jgi:hypothetical protein
MKGDIRKPINVSGVHIRGYKFAAVKWIRMSVKYTTAPRVMRGLDLFQKEMI